MSANPGFRQYDLFIDGQSFFTMPKVYELGIKGGTDRAAISSPMRSSAVAPAITPPRTRDEEEAELQRAITASLQETKQHLDRKALPASEPDLLGGGGGDGDFFSAPPSQPAPALPHSDASVISYSSAPARYGGAPAPYPGAPAPYPGAPPQQQAYPGAPPPPQPYNQAYTSAPVPGMLALPSSQPGYGYPPSQPSPAASAYTAPTYFAPAPAPTTTSYANDFAPVGAEDPFAPKPPTRNDIASEILKGYNGMPTSPAMAPPPFQNGGPPPESSPSQPLSMNGLIEAEEDDSNLSELEKAMRNLVNVDRIDEPAEQKMKLTMKRQEEEKNKKKKNKSEPLPPAAHRMVGSHATLGQIGSVKPKKEIKEGIMSTPPWDPAAAQAGMLVVHGQPNQGPPPLAPRGFGVVHGQQPYTYGQAAAPPPAPQQQQYYGYQQPQYR